MNTSFPYLALSNDNPSKNDAMIISKHDISFLNNKNMCLSKPDSIFPLSSVSLATPSPHFDEVELLRKQRDVAVFSNIYLEAQLRDTQAELVACRRELEKQKKKHEEQLAFLLHEYLPEHQSLLGPIDHNLKEDCEQVGDYIVGDLLGDGYYADVFNGMHCSTKQQFAIKCLKKERIQSNQHMHQLEQELMVLKHASHPNIIRMEEVLHGHNVVYIVMELGHKDLYTYARTVGITEYGLREIMAGILTPLQHLHSIGICHLDIKPENILVMKDVPAIELRREHIKLCDFGLCTISSSSENTVVHQASIKGTPGFFAPEMVEGTFDAKPADMWSVACTLLELSEGFMECWMESYDLYRKDTEGFQQGIRFCLAMMQDRDYFADANVFEIVRDLLRMEPELRLTAAQVLEHDWFLDDCADWSPIHRNSL